MNAPQSLLFLCTGNSARSILAEAILNHRGAGRFRAYSAGSHPTGAVNPFALALLERLGIPTQGARSKSWDEFAQPGAPQFDFIITVCDNAAGETCPVWLGHPIAAHWGVDDPAAVQGDDVAKSAAFQHAFDVLEHRIAILLALPRETFDKRQLLAALREIGKAMPHA